MKYWIIVCLLLLAHGVFGQSLSDLVKMLVADNPTLQALDKERQAQLEEAIQVAQLPDPEFGIGIFPLPVETRLGPQLLRVGAKQSLPWFGTLEATADLATAKAVPLQEQTALQLLHLRYELESAYYEYYELTNTKQIIEEQVSLLERREEILLSEVANGKGNMVDVLEVQMEQKRLAQELLLLTTAQVPAQSKINSLVARSSDVPILLTDSLSFAVLPSTPAALLAQVQRTHPELHYYDALQAIAEQSIVVNEKASKPDFGVGLDYIMVNERDHSFLEGNGRDIVQMSASVRVPLTQASYRAKERQEQLNIDAYNLRKKAALDQLAAEISSAFAAYEQAQIQYDLVVEQERLANSALALIQADYSVAAADFTEILQWSSRLLDFKLDKLRAIVASYQAKARLTSMLAD